ncbi:methionyl-tRNA formyltransferase [Limimonas halophila]|uniref:Methionyl-tRNA formyltransferase n=1 Tax=Limimonas halophila TaxID=1082479 RepID=A0A1G7THN1_9PROT|nr:methionyl-tRNA formyltransferase [Limimonas halophila]SDG34828.1 methionyl-tRNA formyltransferase [Limimonas halophila]
MRLAFFGTPDFAVPTLRALVEAGHEVACVYTQPPRKAGRGYTEQPTPVQAEAERHGIAVETPERLDDEAVQQRFAELNPDAAVVVAYGLIFPAAMLEAPRLGCLNVHASLLPRWRGAAPIQRAILAGDDETGVTVMKMDSGLDTGPIVMQERVAIAADTNAGELHDSLAEVGARLMPKALTALDAGEVTPQPQDDTWALTAPKLTKADRKLDWRRPAIELERLIRALAPKPGATTTLPDGETLKVLRAEVAPGPPSGTPVGKVLDETTFLVSCGLGSLRLIRVQRSGKSPMDTAAFLRGYALEHGARLQ